MSEITAQNVTYLGVPARTVIAEDADGSRVVVTLWKRKAVGQPTEWPEGSITLKRVSGDARDDSLVVHEAAHIVTRDELPEGIASRL